MKQLQNTDITSNWVELFEKSDSLFHPHTFVTTEQFVVMIIRSCRGNLEPTSSSWTSGYIDYALFKGIIEDYDITNIRNLIERRTVARIVHEVLLLEMKEADEFNWSAAENLCDLYFCHTCVIHIAQVYVKGIMLGSDNDIFDVKGKITGLEAEEVIVKMLDKKQRLPKTEGRKLKIVNLSPEEAWQLMLQDNKVKLVDVRTKEEYEKGHIERSVCIPLINISNNPYSVCENRSTPIILYCQKGYKSTVAAQELIGAGYRHIFTIPGLELYPYNLTF